MEPQPIAMEKASIRPVRPEEVCFLIPTKDRPELLRSMIKTIGAMTMRPGQIIVVDGADSAKAVCEEFPELPIDYYTCRPPGQVRQRNLGIEKVRDTIKLVGSFDDDLEVDEKALEAFLQFYNNSEKEYGGVSFNITNRRGYRFNFFKYIFQMSGTRPGQLLPSGYNTNICDLRENIDSDWILGGATLWQHQILRDIKRPDWYGNYAYGEDVEYSILVARNYPLAVCADAKVKDMLGSSAYQMTSDFGRLQVMIRIKMARRLPELSVMAAYWACIGETLESLTRVFVNRDHRYLFRFFGNLKGILFSLLRMNHLRA